ncbi:MAG TPA: hypothetical protein ENK10_02150, partial [Acidobacteria bacterium]|nr:hypothetical protein [Acidobacteriota bacterium]
SAGDPSRIEVEALFEATAAELRSAVGLLDHKLAQVRMALLERGEAAKVARLDAFNEHFHAQHRQTLADLGSLAGGSALARAEAARRAVERLDRPARKSRTVPSAAAIRSIGGRPVDPAAPVVFDIQPPPRISTVVPAYRGGETDAAPGDLDPTPEVQITPEIVSLADKLGRSAVRIYEFVRNQTRFEPYQGSLKGSQAALETLAGNDYDLASLTLALLRESGIPSRYVRGTVRIPTARAQNWLGVRHPDAVSRILGAAGIDNTAIDVSGDGTADYHEIDRVWVEAEVPHADYRGVDGSTGSKVWVPLDPAFKQHKYQPGITGIPDQVPFDESGYLAMRTPLLAYEWYRNQVRDWLDLNMPGKSLADVPYEGVTVWQSLGLLPASLPYDVIAHTAEWSNLPETRRHRVQITLLDQLGTPLLDRTLRDVEVSLSRITISYADTSGGDGIDAPAFLATLTPQLKIDGVVDVSGTSVSTGDPIDIRVRFYFPDDDPVEEVIHEDRPAGDYHALALDLNQVSETWLDRKAQTLIAANEKVGTAEEDPDALEGELLHLTGIRYWQRVEQGDRAITEIYHYRTVKQLFEVLVSGNSTIEYLYDRPFAVTPGNLNVDAKRGAKSRIGLDGEQSKSKDIFMLEGRNGSAQEHAIWEEIVYVDSISTIKSLQYANEIDLNGDGTANSGDVLDITDLAGLDGLCPGFPAGARQSMENAINSGRVVKTPICDFVMNQWNGVGWIEEDPTTGAGAYLISGYLAGGSTTVLRQAAQVRWTAVGPQAFETITACARASHVPMLRLTEPRDVARLRIPAAERRDIREVLRQGRSVEAPAAPVSCDGRTRFAYLIDGPGGGAFESLTTAGGSATENPPPPVMSTRQNGRSRQKYPCADAGQPVRLLNGNMFHVFGDIHIVGVGLNFVFERVYNSQSDRLGPMGYGWSHTYDVFLVEDPGISATVTDGSGRETTFTDLGGGLYDSPPGVHEKLEKDGAGWAMTFVSGEVWSFSAAGRLISMRDVHGNTISMTYDAGDKLISINETLGRDVTLAYGADGMIDSVSDWTGRTWTFDHDAAGNLISSSTPADADTPSYTTTYSYFTVGYLQHNLRQIQYPENYSIDFEYYANDKLFRHTESGLRSMSYNYQPLRRLTTVTDSRGNVTRHTFDAQGATIRIEDADGSVRDFSFDADRNLIERVDRAGNLWTYTWDDRGRIVSATDPLSNTDSYAYSTSFAQPSSYTDRTGATTTYDVDPATGVVNRRTDAAGGEASFTYDGRGRIKTYTDESGQVETRTYDSASGRLAQVDLPLGATWKYGRDTLGRLTSLTDPELNTYSFDFDVLDRQVAVTDPLGGKRTMAYDGLGRLVSQTNESGAVTTVAYDDLGQPVSIIDPLGREARLSWTEPGCGCSTEELMTEYVAPGGRRWSYEYDSRGLLIAGTDPQGATTRFSHDARGLMIERVDPGGSWLRLDYDKAGRLVRMEDNDGEVITRTYDAQDRIVSASSSVTTQNWIRDVVGRVTRFEDSLTGKSIDYSYDAAGRRTQMIDGEGIATVYGYDALGRQTSLTDFSGEAYVFGYDLLDGLTRIEYPNGQVMTRGYDQLGRATSLLTSGPGGAAIDRSYTRDALGRITSMVDAVHGDASYEYDVKGQLLRAIQSGRPSELYTYDAAGNRATDASKIDLVYSDADQLVQRGATRYDYDLRGNLIEKRDASGKTAFSYDARGRLISVDLPDGRNVSFRYGPLGERIEKNVDGEITRMLRDGDEVLARYDGTGTLLAKYVRSGRVAEALAVTRSGTRHYLHQDLRQSTVAVTDTGGAPVARLLYDAFGNLVEGSGTWDDPVRFIGRDFDAELGSYDMQVRQYDPVVGRFLQRDPLGIAFGRESLYPYSANDPVNLFDASGLRPTAPPTSQTIALSGGLLWGVSINVGVISDGDNVGLTVSGGFGSFLGAGASVTGNISVFPGVRDIYDTGGSGLVLGASGGEVIVVGADVIADGDGNIIGYNTATGLGGGPTPGDIHGLVTQTGVVGFSTQGVGRVVRGKTWNPWNSDFWAAYYTEPGPCE